MQAGFIETADWLIRLIIEEVDATLETVIWLAVYSLSTIIGNAKFAIPAPPATRVWLGRGKVEKCGGVFTETTVYVKLGWLYPSDNIIVIGNDPTCETEGFIVSVFPARLATTDDP